MKGQNSSVNKTYLIVVSFFTIIIPLTSFVIEHLIYKLPFTFELFGKWFIFSAVGLRLLLAGIRQITKPGFTAKQIFDIDSPDSLPIVRELGFANLCFGIVGIVSFFIPSWRITSSCASGLYYGLAGFQHLIKKPASLNEKIALWTDLLIFVILLAYILIKFL